MAQFKDFKRQEVNTEKKNQEGDMDHSGSEISHDSNDIDWREFDIWMQDGGYKVKRKVEPTRTEKE